MYKKLLFVIAFLLFLSLGLSLRGVLAKNDDSTSDELPEIEGTYDVPGHPNLKVKVFVYHPKDARPSPRPSPTPVPVNLDCPSDTASDASVPSVGWKLPSTWTYMLNTETVPSSVGSGNFETISANAFSEWVNAVNGNKINVSKTSSDTLVNRAKLDGQNIIAWGRTSGSALAVTYTWYYPSTGFVAEVDTIMNQKFPWFWYATDFMCTDQNSYDAQNILTHELGHWFGLDDVYTSEFTENTMYGYGAKGETKKDTLTSGDASAILSIY